MHDQHNVTGRGPRGTRTSDPEFPTSADSLVSSLILCRKMTKVTLHYDVVSPWSFMAYTSEYSGSPRIDDTSGQFG